MMQGKVIPLDRYRFSKGDSFLIDTNVWFYVYGPQIPGDWKAAAYSRALARVLAAQCSVFIDILVLSEFVNRYSRLEFEQQKQAGGMTNFKTFRKSTAFPPIAKAIADAVRRILKQSRRIDSSLESMDMDAFMADYETSCPDFNDLVLGALCTTRGLKLISHDADFRDYEITILTANRSLL